jgi:DNA replication protein DnaC
MISDRKVAFEKRKIVNECKKCSGTGCGSCFGYCAFIDRMAESGIPVDYWYRMMDDFYGEANFKKIITDYIANINQEYSNGLTLCLVGERGRGKSMAACCILKKAILENYTVFYTTLSDLVTRVIGPDPELRLYIKQYDFVVIDEVDQRFFPTQQSMELFGNQLENILRARMQNRLPSIMCSNSLDISQIFGGEFKKSFESLGSQFIKVVPASGIDAREGKEKLC